MVLVKTMDIVFIQGHRTTIVILDIIIVVVVVVVAATNL